MIAYASLFPLSGRICWENQMILCIFTYLEDCKLLRECITCYKGGLHPMVLTLKIFVALWENK